ncbi:DUF3717 domain-containing protein [Burkholderia latens]|uniref:DUF3717 domain-containing protein n=1 Tax=Burkholderia latens TaxID=488446 RepID=UPI0039A6BD51
MTQLFISDVEKAINHWRDRRPSPDGIHLCAEAGTLATLYAMMIVERRESVDASSLQHDQIEALRAVIAL